jgi:UTP--glucose-1-phosphate uridylyltransferase
MILDEVDPASREVLEAYGFDPVRFEELRGRVASGELSAAANVVSGTLEPLPESMVTSLPEPDTPGHAEALELGVDALRSGRVAAVVLAGGMATRFGGVVKGLVEAIDGRSFLDVKLQSIAAPGRELGAEVPVALMTSFATDAPTRAYLDARAAEHGRPIVFSQYVAPRLEPDGTLFRDADGNASLYGPGHGDLVEALRASGAAAELRARGVRHVLVSNVDNLAARLDPAVVGMHVRCGTKVTTEVAAREGDVGGAPVLLDGRPRLLEGPQFPPGFDVDRLSVFNTNTATIDLDVLESERELTWLYVEKEVGGRRAVQLERLYHEVAAQEPTTFLLVPRSGPRGRFLPIKVPADLERARDELRRLAAAVDA